MDPPASATEQTQAMFNLLVQMLAERLYKYDPMLTMLQDERCHHLSVLSAANEWSTLAQEVS